MTEQGPSRPCIVQDCSQFYAPYIGTARGMCPMHYARWQKHGDPGSPEPKRALKTDSIFDRLVRYTLIDDGCWQWVGALHEYGYGVLGMRGTTYRAHRLWYEEMIGPIPNGQVLDHLCRNRGCVNPWHVEPVTQERNMSRTGYHCPHCNCEEVAA